jgi:hypothetical protein
MMNDACSLLIKEYGLKIKEIYQSYKADPSSLWKLAEPGFLFAAFEKIDFEDQLVSAFFEKVENITNRNSSDLQEIAGNIVITGRFLFFNPSATMYDCLAEKFTDGFFDSDDVPPPEFWLCRWNSKLVSFIPSELFDRANVGVEHSTSGCLEWGAGLIEL